MATYDVVIVGAGHAGAQLAMTLRQKGFSGSIVMLGDEPHPPYERPPLSKEFLSGDKSFERIMIRPASFWQEKDILWTGNTRVVAVDPLRHSVRTETGDNIGYDRLVWAAGGAARRLAYAGGEAGNVHVIRRHSDVVAIMAALPQTRHVTVVGGGYIGLEAAAVLRKFGKAVTLLEAGSRVLGRVAGEDLSRFYEAEHRRQGVDLRLEARIKTLELNEGLVTSVCLVDDVRIATDMLIVGIGINPEVGPLCDAGAEIANGVKVDAFCRTSLDDIYAIGDCAAHVNCFSGGAAIRVESVQNAHDQARTVAAHLVGQELPYEAIPWFWSNQYDLKLQTVGLSSGYDEVIVRGDMSSRSFSILYLREGRLIAVDAVNNVKDYVQAKPLILAGAPLEQALLADRDIPLRGY